MHAFVSLLPESPVTHEAFQLTQFVDAINLRRDLIESYLLSLTFQFIFFLQVVPFVFDLVLRNSMNVFVVS